MDVEKGAKIFSSSIMKSFGASSKKKQQAEIDHLKDENKGLRIKI